MARYTDGHLAGIGIARGNFVAGLVDEPGVGVIGAAVSLPTLVGGFVVGGSPKDGVAILSRPQSKAAINGSLIADIMIRPQKR